MNYEILTGDCVESMKLLPEKLFNTCVTSPPYYGLRDYDAEGQIGLEKTPENFIEKLVNVFREVHRVLRDDGTLWVNIGDSYGKDKQLLGIPWKLAFALQSSGWILRQDIIWHKTNPMPESVKDRCTRSHEYIFLLSKSHHYFFDNEAIKETAISKPRIREKRNGENATDTKKRGSKSCCGVISDKKCKRDVWSVSTKSYKGSHCAVFPPDLIEPCILAGCPEYGVVLDPFGGSGTTAGIAVKHNRFAYLCEINPDYVKLIPTRVHQIVTG